MVICPVYAALTNCLVAGNMSFWKKPRQPRSRPSVKPKSQNQKVVYRYTLMKQAGFKRIREFSTKEEAAIQKMKLEEKAPGFKYKILAVKQPPRRKLL